MMGTRKQLVLSNLSLGAIVLFLLVAALDCLRLREQPAVVIRGGGVEARIIGDTPPTQGPMAKAAEGDFVLSDGDVMIVVAGAARGGHLIDVGRVADQGYDYLGRLVPIYSAEREAAYTIDSVEIAAAAAGQAPPAIVSKGHDLRRPGLRVETRYELLATSHAILLTTHLRNGTSETLSPMLLGDRIWWGADNIFVPWIGNLDRSGGGATSGTWLCSWQDNFSLGVTPEAGGSIRAGFEKDNATLLYREGPLSPGAEVAYRRYLPVRDRQISSVSEFAWKLHGQRLGWLDGEVRELQTNQPVAGCNIEILSSLRLPEPLAQKPETWTWTDENGRFRVALPDGRHFAWTRKTIGRFGQTRAIDHVVVAGQTTTIKQPLQVSPKIMLGYEVRDAETRELLPCKLTFVTAPGQQAVDFGPDFGGLGWAAASVPQSKEKSQAAASVPQSKEESQAAASVPQSRKREAGAAPGARQSFFSATGQGELNLSPGRYRVFVSRGPEYQPFVRDITINPSSPNTLTATLPRLKVHMDDYVSVDLGVRTQVSPGCRVSARDRVVAAAAEGVQILVTGDEGAATDLSPAIAEAGLSKWVSAISGRRVKWQGTDATGEFLVFPCPPGPADPAQLRRERQARAPADLIAALRRGNPQSLLSVCRPMDRRQGYLARLGLTVRDPKPPQLPPKAMDFDLFEAFSPETDVTTATQLVLPIYCRLLSEFGRFGLAAGSDSRYLRGEECGYPRLYVARSKKEPAFANASARQARFAKASAGKGFGGLGEASSPFEQIRDGLLEGRVLVTNGPFIRLLVNGQPPGSLVTDRDGVLDVLMEVRAAPWVDQPWIEVQVAVVYEGGQFVLHRNVPLTKDLLRVPHGVGSSPEFTIPRGIGITGPYKQDVVIIATAVGTGPLGPIVAHDDMRGFRAYPFAMTGPIFVDVDGDGQCKPRYQGLVERREF